MTSSIVAQLGVLSRSEQGGGRGSVAAPRWKLSVAAGSTAPLAAAVLPSAAAAAANDGRVRGHDLRSPVHQGKHVGVEIHPTATRPRDVEQTDANDDPLSCWYLSRNDRSGSLTKAVDLSLLQCARAHVGLGELLKGQPLLALF